MGFITKGEHSELASHWFQNYDPNKITDPDNLIVTTCFAPDCVSTRLYIIENSYNSFYI
jgi:hypothetical protein